MLTKTIEQFLNNDERPRINYLQMLIHADGAEPKFRASDAGRCRLYRYWKRQGKPQPAQDIDHLKIMEMGNLLHAWLDYALESAGILYNAEITVENTHVKGHIDAIVDYHGGVTLYDYKTIGGRQAWYMLNNGCKAKKEHQYQVLTYMDLFNADDTATALHGKIDAARIAYITREEVSGKNSDKLPPLTVIADIRADLDLLRAVREDWQILIDAWLDGVAPQANPEKWECKFCPYKDACEFLII